MSNDRIFFWGSVAAILAISVYAIVSVVGGDSNTYSPSSLSENDHVKGNPDAAVVLIEYSDFQCPACGNAAGMVREVMAEFSDHVAFAYRHFPLRSIHDKADLSAEAAEAAGIQGKFFEMHDMLFENQRAWERLQPSEAKKTFISYATDLDLDLEKFLEDFDSKEVDNIVDDHYKASLDAGLNSTPSFFLNGEKISPRSVDQFRSLIREAIEQTK